MNRGPQKGTGSNGDDMTFVEKASLGWIEGVPDWVGELAAEADATGLRQTAARLGVSITLVSQAIRNNYGGDLTRAEEIVRGALMGKVVWCQGVGDDVARHTCLDWQKKPFVATSPDRTRMYRACRNNCPHFKPQAKGPSAITDQPGDANAD